MAYIEYAKVCTKHDLCNVLPTLLVAAVHALGLRSAWQTGDPLNHLRHLVRLKFHGALARDLASLILVRLTLRDNALSESEEPVR